MDVLWGREYKIVKYARKPKYARRGPLCHLWKFKDVVEQDPGKECSILFLLMQNVTNYQRLKGCARGVCLG